MLSIIRSNNFLAGLIFLLCCFFCFYFKKPKVTACVCVVSSLTGTVFTTKGAISYFVHWWRIFCDSILQTGKAVLLTVHMLVVFNMEEDKVGLKSCFLIGQTKLVKASDWRILIANENG